MNNIIKQIIVVEGKTDTSKLQNLFDNIQTFETHGQQLNKKMINTLKQINSTRGIICFLDPDGPGKLIRQKIINSIPNCQHAFIDKKDMVAKSKKIGIAEATPEAIKEALKNVLTFIPNNESISWSQYLDLNLNNKLRRITICNHLKIDYYNHKQLFKILNYLNKNFLEIKIIID